MDDDTLSCPLQEGETTFIISFPKTSLLDPSLIPRKRERRGAGEMECRLQLPLPPRAQNGPMSAGRPNHQ